MKIEEDFYTDFIDKLNSKKVEYMIIGAFAVNIHGYNRATIDIDIWSNPTNENTKRLLEAIEEFGFDTAPLKGKDLKKIGVMPIKLKKGEDRIDILTNVTGDLNFDKTYKKSEVIILKGDKPIQLRVIGYSDLIKTKKPSMRMQDQVDIHELSKIKNKEKKYRKGKGLNI